MDSDSLARVLFPIRGLLSGSGVSKHGFYGQRFGPLLSEDEERARFRCVPSKNFVFLLLFLLIFATIVPAIQAFTTPCETLGLPGWAWGFLILFFWPVGIIWLILRNPTG